MKTSLELQKNVRTCGVRDDLKDLGLQSDLHFNLEGNKYLVLRRFK